MSCPFETDHRWKLRDDRHSFVCVMCDEQRYELISMSSRTTMTTWMYRQIDWSSKAFGLGLRTVGITEHIKKEIEEIRAHPHDLEEWIDVITLGLDGFWRHGGYPHMAMQMLYSKLGKNMARTWPTPTSEDEAVLHTKSSDTAEPEQR